MTKAFARKVRKYCAVDTRKYRYILTYSNDGYEIWRLPLYKLDTVAALTDWKKVYTF